MSIPVILPADRYPRHIQLQIHGLIRSVWPLNHLLYQSFRCIITALFLFIRCQDCSPIISIAKGEVLYPSKFKCRVLLNICCGLIIFSYSSRVRLSISHFSPVFFTKRFIGRLAENPPSAISTLVISIISPLTWYIFG